LAWALTLKPFTNSPFSTHTRSERYLRRQEAGKSPGSQRSSQIGVDLNAKEEIRESSQNGCCHKSDQAVETDQLTMRLQWNLLMIRVEEPLAIWSENAMPNPSVRRNGKRFARAGKFTYCFART